MHGRIDRKQKHLQLSRSPHLQLLHPLTPHTSVTLLRLWWTQIQQESDRDDECAPEICEQAEEERRRFSCGGCGSGRGGAGRVGGRSADEFGVGGGDGFAGEVELVDFGAGEEGHGVEDACADE